MTTIRRHISIFMLLVFFMTRVSVIAPIVYAEEEQKQEAPATEEKPPQEKSPPKPENPPSAPSDSSSPVPTSAPAPTTSASVPQPSSPPQPTSPPLPEQSTQKSDETHHVDSSSGSTHDSTRPDTEHHEEHGGSQDQQEQKNIPLTGPHGSGANAYKKLYGSEKEQVTNSDQSDATSSANDPYNTLTGPFSANAASEKNDATSQVTNVNEADVNNFVNLITSSGFNYANLNTLPGEIVTGDATQSVNLLNMLNSNVTGQGDFSVQNIYGTHVGDITFSVGSSPDTFTTASGQVTKNAVTGPVSENTADTNDTFVVKQENGNEASLINDITLQAITGKNTASMNTGNGKITTGNASALANIVNMVNTNILAEEWVFGVINIYGSQYGNIILPGVGSGNVVISPSGSTQTANTVTGPSSDNSASTGQAASESTTNTNTADVENNLQLQSNSGDNNASMNTSGGTIQTGDAKGVINTTSVANVNATSEDGTVWLVIVNEMGKWVGHIIGMPWGATTSSSLPVTAGVSGSTQTSNTTTGPLSENQAQDTAQKTSETTNENDAKIVNNISVTADTGNNSASMNTGSGDIKTGNAYAGINLMNIANVNIVAKKFIAVFVNVLGSFVGDVVTPGQTAERTVQAPASSSSQSSQSHIVSQTVTPTPTGIAVASVNQTITQSSHQSISYIDSSSSVLRAVSSYIYPTKRSSISSAWGSDASSGVVLSSQAGRYTRGVYMSQKFIDATDQHRSGFLIMGTRLHVTRWWLMILPFAYVYWLLRRKKSFSLKQYVSGIKHMVL